VTYKFFAQRLSTGQARAMRVLRDGMSINLKKKQAPRRNYIVFINQELFQISVPRYIIFESINTVIWKMKK
jgi:hypothetical protein